MARWVFHLVESVNQDGQGMGHGLHRYASRRSIRLSTHHQRGHGTQCGCRASRWSVCAFPAASPDKHHQRDGVHEPDSPYFHDERPTHEQRADHRPRLPPAARVDSIEGAQEFVKYFMAQFNRSWTESDPTLLVPLCLPTSKTCAAYIGKAKDYRDRGLRYVGIPVEVQSVQGFEWISGSAAVRVRGKQSSGKVVDSNGSVVQEAPANSGSVVFQLEHNGLWRVSEIQGEAVTR